MPSRLTQHLNLMFLAFVLSPSLSQAELIGVGLDWRTGIFIQEFWHKGEPSYLLVNLTDKEAEITVHEFVSRWRLGQPLGPAAAGPWKVAAGRHSLVSAKALTGERLWRFVLAGRNPLGVLPSVGSLPYKGDGYATSLGLNGSGGTTPGLFLVQPSLSFEPNAEVQCELHLPHNVGVLKLKRSTEKTPDLLRPQDLAISAATSKSLRITKDEKHFTIDTSVPLQDSDEHVVRLTIKLPGTDRSTLTMIDGWLAKGSGGSGVTRAFWIEKR